MDRTKKKWVWVAAPILVAVGVGILVYALAERHEKRERHSRGSYYTRVSADSREEKHEREYRRSGRPPTVGNANYKGQCGECHMAYPPELLPSASWDKILTRLGDHFGESLSLDAGIREEIRKYLVENAAERAGTETAGKVLRGLGGASPVRITELPYIQRKHREISPQVFQRQAVGSFSNCRACHPDAERGDFDDDRAAIPK